MLDNENRIVARVVLTVLKVATTLVFAVVTYGLWLEVAANPVLSATGFYDGRGIQPFIFSSAVTDDVTNILTLDATLLFFLAFKLEQTVRLRSFGRMTVLAATPVLVHVLCIFLFNNFGGIGCPD